jgi:carotenoid cleavage dioxygenase-like enzyme
MDSPPQLHKVQPTISNQPHHQPCQLHSTHVNTFQSTKPSTPSATIVSKGPFLIHDFILSDNYCIFNLNPVASYIQVEFDLNTKGSGPAGALQKVDTEHPELSETYAFEPYEFPGEAVFAAKAGKDVTQQEDAGYLIVHIVNGKDRTTDFAIFDVEGKGSFEKGPVVRQRLPVFLPHMLHGNFFEGVTFDFDSFATK